MRVAFSIFGGAGWTGGINYLRNLLSAVGEMPGTKVQPILFIAPETSKASVEVLLPYLAKPPVVVPGWSLKPGSRLLRLAGSALLQRDLVSTAAFKRENIDLVFQHAAWYGLAFPIPTLAWIADFQHRHLPQMFALPNRLKRDLGYWALSHSATRVLLSSRDALRDCENFFPAAKGRTAVLPFCVQLPTQAFSIAPESMRDIYALPARYFYLPNQLWKHKNHMRVLDALKLLRDGGLPVFVVASGNPSDVRNPDYPRHLVAAIAEKGLEENFRFLGLIPYDHIIPLMRGAAAVINPSLFEGWSTTVEEAKAVGVPLLLSDIGVHREQAAGNACYFDPLNVAAIADCLASAWQDVIPAQRRIAEDQALVDYRNMRTKFAEEFVRILQDTISKPTGRA